jgi:RND family efflux transporter MFP subunit
MKKVRVRLLLMLGIVTVVAGCGSRQPSQPQLGEVERLPRLEVIQPEKDFPLAIKHKYTATVDSLEKADLCAQVRGLVKEFVDSADIGRHVKAGEPLVILHIPDLIAERDHKKALLEQATNVRAEETERRLVAAEELKEAQALERRYQADLDYRELQFARVVKLAKGETVAQQLAEEAKLQHASAEAALKAAQAQIRTKQARLQAADVELKVADSKINVAKAELDRAQALVSFGTIVAPFDGVITKRWLDRGAIIKDPGMPLLTVMRADRVRVILDVSERDVPFLHAEGIPSKGVPGNPVTLHIPALHKLDPSLEFKGRITLMASALDPVTRTMRTEVHLPNPSGLLKPQMTGTAEVVLVERKALTIPSSALVRTGRNVEVYYLANPTGEPPRGVVKTKQVTLGVDDGLRVEILKNSLTGQELIIRKGNGVVRLGDQAVAVPAEY